MLEVRLVLLAKVVDLKNRTLVGVPSKILEISVESNDGIARKGMGVGGESS